MPLLADRVKESTTTQGTGTLTLAGAPPGFRTFTGAFGNGASVYYVIAGPTEWEIGFGTTGAGTLTRDTVLVSSAGGTTKVNLSAGPKDVFCSYVADRAVTTSDAATLTNKTIDDYTNNVGANSTHFRIKAGATLAKGDVIKASGFTPGEQAIEVVKTASATDVAIGIVEQALSTGQFGTAVVIGELFDVNTNGLSVGATLYQNGAGGYTTTKPSSGFYQALGWVVRANTSNGVIAVNVVTPLYVETSTNTANTSVLRDGSGNFAAGTITAALSGNASTATALQTARTINGVSFNGTADITVTAAAGTLTGSTLASGVTASSLTSVGTLTSLAVSGNVTLNSTSGSVAINTTPSITHQLIVKGTTTDSSRNALLIRDSADASIAAFRNDKRTDLYGDTAIVGNLAVDTNTLFVDAVNNRVGVNCTPVVPAQIRTQTNGNVGFQPATVLSGGNKINNFNDAAAVAVGLELDASAHALLISGTEALRVDAARNLGLGVTPSAWINGRGIDVGVYVGLSDNPSGGGGFALSGNAYEYASGSWKYKQSYFATLYRTYAGEHHWLTASSGTAGNPITFGDPKMTLDANGYLAIGTTTTTSARVNIQNSDALNELVFRGTDYTNILSETTGGMQFGITSTTGTAALAFLTLNTERARIKSGGQVRFIPLAAAPGGAEDGDVYYDSGTNKLRVRAGGAWVDLH